MQAGYASSNVAKGSTSVYSFSLMFAPNNDVLSSNDSANGNWIYTYDDFNRLLTADGPSSQNFGYEYDQFGNRWDQTGPNMSSLAFNANNQVTASGITYDANGNTTDDGVHPYVYDAENHLIADNQPAYQDYYLYDAEGRRVRRISGGWTFDYVYDLNGTVITEMEGLNPDRLEVYAGGRHLATANQCEVVYNHADWLGTERVRTNASDTQYPAVIPGSVANTCTSLPFGDNLNCTLAPDVNPNHGDIASTHFTGKDRDPETNLDNFEARYYSSAMGHFMTPDWSKNPQGVPYADFSRPQSLNLYSYVENNPTTLVDPDGHEGEGGGVGTEIEEGLDLMSQEANTVANEVGAGMSSNSFGPIVAVGTALGVEAFALIDAHAIQVKADADMKMQGEINRNIQQINANNQAQQQQASSSSPEMAEHKSNARPSTVQKHQTGQARKKRDAGGEKGDKQRQRKGMYPKKRPKGHKGPWPPRPLQPPKPPSEQFYE
jgi:RHS repeat-associated protein